MLSSYIHTFDQIGHLFPLYRTHKFFKVNWFIRSTSNWKQFFQYFFRCISKLSIFVCRRSLSVDRNHWTEISFYEFNVKWIKYKLPNGNIYYAMHAYMCYSKIICYFLLHEYVCWYFRFERKCCEMITIVAKTEWKKMLLDVAK